MMELVTGGSGSGKSAYAEKIICEKHRQLCGTAEKPPLYYIADMVPYGRETEKKIEAHRKMRAGKGFATIEWYVDLPGRILGPDSPDLKGSYVLLECISNLTANEMYEPGGAENTGKDTVKCIIRGVQMLKERCAHLVVVTNDVFRESVPDSEEMTAYKDNLGTISRALAKMADRVTEVVFGVPVCIKEVSDTASGTWDWRKGIDAQKDGSEEKGRRSMKFITGGAYQGKLNYAKETFQIPDGWMDGAFCTLEDLAQCRGVYDFHLLIRRLLEEGQEADRLVLEAAEKNPEIRSAYQRALQKNAKLALPLIRLHRKFKIAGERPRFTPDWRSMMPPWRPQLNAQEARKLAMEQQHIWHSEKSPDIVSV